MKKVRGIYLFRFRLYDEENIRVGGLGLLKFPAGYYIYVGSALNGLAYRLRRHLEGAPGGRVHWHVDYLSSRGLEKEFAVVLTGRRAECELAAAVAILPGAHLAVSGFGSSDCRCPGHLYRLEKLAWPDYPGLVEIVEIATLLV